MPDKLKNSSDHDLLIECVTLLGVLERQFSNHLEHHNREKNIYLKATIFAVITAFVSLAGVVMTVLSRSIV